MSFFENKAILVTGGAGAIGSNLVNALSRSDCKIIVLDNLSSGFKENINKRKNIRFINSSILNDKILNKTFKSNKIKIVFHLAAHFGNLNSIRYPREDLLTNGMGTLKLLQMSYKNSVERFVYASSSCVYGNKKGFMKEGDQDFDLETPYAITKLLGEKYTHFFHEYYGLNTIILRYFNSYGPGEFPGKYRNVIPNFIYHALRNEPLTITGSGDETRDFTFIKDIIKGTMLAAEKGSAIGQTFNLGFGKETKIKIVAEKINKITGNRGGVRYVERRKWDNIQRRIASIDKAKRLLGYKPEVGLDEGLKVTIEWFKKNTRLVK